MQKLYPALMLALCANASFAYDDPRLGTKNDVNAGVHFSHYVYEEPSVDVRIHGIRYGAEAEATGVFRNHQFLRGQIKYSYGELVYSGSGNATHNPDWYYDMRILTGKDLEMMCGVLAPYIGLGFRYLHDDLRGYTDIGAAGYRRFSHYYYLPVGLDYRFVNGTHPMDLNLEAGYMFYGRQTSKFDDISAGFAVTLGEANNNQHGGFNLRTSLLVGIFCDWEVGPYATYWQVEKSDLDGDFGAYEPENHTLEYGLKIVKHF